MTCRYCRNICRPLSHLTVLLHGNEQVVDINGGSGSLLWGQIHLELLRQTKGCGPQLLLLLVVHGFHLDERGEGVRRRGDKEVRQGETS